MLDVGCTWTHETQDMDQFNTQPYMVRQIRLQYDMLSSKIEKNTLQRMERDTPFAAGDDLLDRRHLSFSWRTSHIIC